MNAALVEIQKNLEGFSPDDIRELAVRGELAQYAAGVFVAVYCGYCGAFNFRRDLIDACAKDVCPFKRHEGAV